MPRPHIPTVYEIELQRKINHLSTRLLEVNATLRIKTLYAEKLEYLLRHRHERIDQLFAMLTQAQNTNRRLEAECEHLAHLIAASPDNAPKLIAS